MDDRATMLAMHLFEATIEAKRAEHRDAVREREEKGGSADNDFKKLKERLRHRGP